MNIGTVEFRNQAIFLAPMEKITEHSFRFMCKMFGADMVYTEFVSSDVLIYKGKKSLAKLEIDNDEKPIGIQIYGHILEAMREAAIIAELAKPDIIDINFGCPAKKIVGRGAGAGMMKDVAKMVEITKAIVNTVKLPVTVKTRLGWDEHSKNVVDIAERLQDVGIKALTIHGRTATQQYKGVADWELIGAVKNNPRMKIPIIGNGDVNSATAAKDKFDRYGIDAIMIGRATIGKPWLFKEIKQYLDKGVFLPPLTIKKIVEIAKTHFQKSIDFKEGERGLFEMRKYFSLYFKHLPDFEKMRFRLLTSKCNEEILLILREIEEKYEGL